MNLHDQGRAIAVHLPGWQVQAPDEGHTVHFIGPRGSRFRMWEGHTGRLEFCYLIPDGVAGQDHPSFAGVPPCMISCNGKRAPDSIAKDIERRLIPMLESRLERVFAYRDKEQARRARVLDVMQTAVRSLPTETDIRRNGPYSTHFITPEPGKVSGRVETSDGESIRLELWGLTPALLEGLLKWLPSPTMYRQEHAETRKEAP